MVRASGSAARRRRIAAAALIVANTSSHRGESRSSPPPVIEGPAIGPGVTSEPAVVVTVTEADAELVPSGVTELGEIVHVASEGAPLQASATG